MPFVVDLDKHRPAAVPATHRRLKGVCARRGIEDVADPSSIRQSDLVVALSKIRPVWAVQAVSLRANTCSSPAHDADDFPYRRAFMDRDRFDVAHWLGESNQRDVIRTRDEVEEASPFARLERGLDHLLWCFPVSGVDNDLTDRSRRTAHHDNIDRLLPAHRVGGRNNPLVCDENPMALTGKICQSGKIRKVHSVQ